METIKKEKSKSGVSHHVSHFLVTSRPEVGYNAHHLRESIDALEQENNITQSPIKLEKNKQSFGNFIRN